MKYIDLYEEEEFLTNEDDIIEWINQSFTTFDLRKLTIESDGVVYDGDLQMKSRVTELKVRFKSVSGYFLCRDSGIIDLEGFPQSVKGNFYCNNTNITSLKHCPKLIGSGFYCDYTNITSLKFCPNFVGNEFFCYDTQISDPKEYRYALYSEIGGKFSSSNVEIDKIINAYKGSANKKYWAKAIAALSRIKL